ncbi:hypothetical protein [Arthrobacter oryzae]|uniref:hypothetical protein n=1 Tax=Arthrobacter oryzae TaxID=409290 RepID=UPI0030C9E922
MHTSEKTARIAQARHLQESLVTQLAKGREWATPGIEAALHRALTGMDSGIEAASPRIQASLRAIADELAGGVEAVVPRVHEGITRITPKAVAFSSEPAQAAKPGAQSLARWWVAGVAAAAAFCGVLLWRRRQSANTAATNTAPGNPRTDDLNPAESAEAPA